MNTVERIKSICKERKIPISKLEKDLNFGNAYISGLKKGTVPDDRLRAISKYLDLSVEYLMTGEENKGYYLNEETSKLAQEMFEDEDMRSLFDMKRKMPPERFKAHMEFMKNLYKQETGEDI